jgi:two-component system chemotaxis response regulator CheY
MRVMLVDDDSRMRQVLARLLLSAGLTVSHEAGDGAEALVALDQGDGVDLIVTDCRMPRMDGIAFVTALRARGDRTPVIMLSGEHDPHLIVRAVKAGVSNYVPKPLNPAAFFEKIWQTLAVTRAVAV